MPTDNGTQDNGSRDPSKETSRTTSRRLSRRRVLQGGGAIGISTIAGCSAFSGGDNDELVVSSYGGAFDDVMETIIEDFESEANATVSLAPYTTVSQIEGMSEDPDIGVALLDDFDVIAGGTDLFVELDPDLVTRYDQQYDSAYLPNDAGISHIFGAYGLAYDTEAWSESDLGSWTDLWNDEFEGELAIQNDWPLFMVIAARALGGSETDMDPLWEELPALSENVEVFYEEFAAPEQLFNQGQVTVASWFDGRTFALRDAGESVSFAIPEEGATQVRGAAAAIQNSGVEELAQEFIDHLLDPEVQVQFAEDLYYGPTNTETNLSSGVEEDVVTEDDLADLIVPDWEYINANRDEFTSNWQENI